MPIIRMGGIFRRKRGSKLGAEQIRAARLAAAVEENLRRPVFVGIGDAYALPEHDVARDVVHRVAVEALAAVQGLVVALELSISELREVGQPRPAAALGYEVEADEALGHRRARLQKSGPESRATGRRPRRTRNDA